MVTFQRYTNHCLTTGDKLTGLQFPIAPIGIPKDSICLPSQKAGINLESFPAKSVEQ
jgi:hypothetical protein